MTTLDARNLGAVGGLHNLPLDGTALGSAFFRRRLAGPLQNGTDFGDITWNKIDLILLDPGLNVRRVNRRRSREKHFRLRVYAGSSCK